MQRDLLFLLCFLSSNHLQFQCEISAVNFSRGLRLRVFLSLSSSFRAPNQQNLCSSDLHFCSFLCLFSFLFLFFFCFVVLFFCHFFAILLSASFFGCLVLLAVLRCRERVGRFNLANGRHFCSRLKPVRTGLFGGLTMIFYDHFLPSFVNRPNSSRRLLC